MADDPVLELYKLEYDKCATRYENIYQAMWRIFSHLAFVSGAVLSFGSERLVPPFFWFLVTFPLAFWFLSTFIPLNRYGKLTSGRLKAIEAALNKKYGTDLGHYTEFVDSRKLLQANRTQTWVVLTFFPITLIWAGFLASTVCAVWQGQPLLRQPEKEAVRVTLDSKELVEAVRSITIPASGDKLRTPAKP